MQQVAATPPKVRKTLRLKHAVDGEHEFTVGDNCDGIERVDGAYEVHRGSKMFRVELPSVSHFEQDPRPGYGQEQRDAGKLPSFCRPTADGAWSCSECGLVKRSVHAIRTHYGIAHGGAR